MKRSSRQIKPNSKYFDSSFKSPRMDTMLSKNEQVASSISTMGDGVVVSDDPADNMSGPVEDVKGDGDGHVKTSGPSKDVNGGKVETSLTDDVPSVGIDVEDVEMVGEDMQVQIPQENVQDGELVMDGDTPYQEVKEIKIEDISNVIGEKDGFDDSKTNKTDADVVLPDKIVSYETEQTSPQNDVTMASGEIQDLKGLEQGAESISLKTEAGEDLRESSSGSASTSLSTSRPARHIKPNTKYMDVASSSSLPDVNTEESGTTSANRRTSRQPKQNRKYADSTSDTVECTPKREPVRVSPKSAAFSETSSGFRPRVRLARQVQTAAAVVKPTEDEDSPEEYEAKRPCRIAGCPAVAPMCFASCSERCTGNKYTSRWNHISTGEHFCNECFEYFRGKREISEQHIGGLKMFETWKAVWSSKARRPSSIATYLVEQRLPYWACCRDCGKWRQLPRVYNLTHEMLKDFTCASLVARGNKVKKKDIDTACDFPEDTRVEQVRNWPGFFRTQPVPSLSKSPAAPFLTTYYPDGVGLSPTEAMQPITKAERKKLCPYVVPFAKEDRPLHAFGMTADMMLDTEIAEFPDMALGCPYLYLGLRNLVLALWALNPTEWITPHKVETHIICRGLARISLVEKVPQLLHFLTRNGYINQGLLSPPAASIDGCHSETSVLVIGAGASGLAAAHCLHSHGVKVTVLEAKSSLGGRVGGQWAQFGVDKHSGQLLNGCWNNPIAVMAYQTGIRLERQSDSCPLLTSQGQLVPEDLDRRIEFHYNAILDIVSDWRRGRSQQADVPLIDKFKELHEEFIRETQGYFSETAFSHQEVKRLVNFYLSNLEFAMGCSLDRSSTLFWDQNEDLPQFGGAHMVVPGGFGLILESMAEGIDVRLGCEVQEINYKDQNEIAVQSSQGNFTANKVIVTVPLTVLQKEVITFEPPLPESKLKAINALGAGKVEKVTLQFENDFWSKKIEYRSLFGHVPESEDNIGLFNVFYCRHHSETDTHFLISHLVGRGLEKMADKSDEEILQVCLQVLQSLFPEQDIPQPMASSVSRWSNDPHIGMAYSHIPVGASGDTYDEMASVVDGCLHFAGEATNRQFPQTVTGAYLSGVREAWSILDDLSDNDTSLD